VGYQRHRAVAVPPRRGPSPGPGCIDTPDLVQGQTEGAQGQRQHEDDSWEHHGKLCCDDALLTATVRTGPSVRRARPGQAPSGNGCARGQHHEAIDRAVVISLDSADLIAPERTTTSNVAANAHAARVPTAYSAVVIPGCP